MNDLSRSSPLVSIVLYGRVGESAIGSAKSIIAQTYRPIELICIDSAEEEIRSFLDNVKIPEGITVTFREQNGKTIPQAISEAFKFAKGDYFSILSAPDIYPENRIERCVNVALSRKCALLVTYVDPVDENGKPLWADDPWLREYQRTMIFDITLYPTTSVLAIFYNLVVAPGNLFFRRDVLADEGYFLNYEYFFDLDFFLRAALKEEPALVRENLYNCRIPVHRFENNEAFTGYNNEHAKVIQTHLKRLFSSKVENPFANVFEADPFTFAGLQWKGAIAKAFDDFLEQPQASTKVITPESGRPAVRSESGKHFTIFTHALSFTGAPVIVLELADLLKRRGYNVNVISPSEGPLRPQFERRGIPVHVPRFLAGGIVRWENKAAIWCGYGQRGFPWNLPYRFFKMLRTIANGIYFELAARQVKGTLLVNSISAWPLALKILKRWKGPAYWYIHETLSPRWMIGTEAGIHQFERQVKTGSLKLIYGSEATREYCASQGFDGEVRYWSGLPRSSVIKKRNSRSGRRVILNVASTSPRKGTRNLLEAFAIARRRRLIPDDVELCFVGSMLPSHNLAARDLVRRASQLDVKGFVRIVPECEPDLIPPYYAEATAYVHASVFDCMPIALLTAMAHGLPIVTTDADGCKEAILHEKCGLVVPPRNPELLAEAIGRLFAKEEEAARFGEAARTRFNDVFSLEATIDPLLKLMRAD